MTKRAMRAVTALALSALFFFCAAIWANGPTAVRTASAPEFETFQVILDRNIFNPSRRPVRRPEGSVAVGDQGNEDADSTTRGASAFSASSEYLSVTGALLYDEEAVAFITGSRPEYVAVVRQGETIAGLRVESIGTNEIVLRNGERAITVPVGFGLSRNGDGPWLVSALPSTSSYAYAGGTSTEQREQMESSDYSENAGPSDGPSEDLLERLRQRRQQELDQ